MPSLVKKFMKVAVPGVFGAGLLAGCASNDFRPNDLTCFDVRSFNVNALVLSVGETSSTFNENCAKHQVILVMANMKDAHGKPDLVLQASALKAYMASDDQTRGIIERNADQLMAGNLMRRYMSGDEAERAEILHLIETGDFKTKTPENTGLVCTVVNKAAGKVPGFNGLSLTLNCDK